jgi:hypothetical protein
MVKNQQKSTIDNNFRGNEEREGKIPFEKGVGFDLVIINEQTHFQVGFKVVF